MFPPFLGGPPPRGPPPLGLSPFGHFPRRWGGSPLFPLSPGPKRGPGPPRGETPPGFSPGPPRAQGPFWSPLGPTAIMMAKAHRIGRKGPPKKGVPPARFQNPDPPFLNFPGPPTRLCGPHCLNSPKGGPPEAKTHGGESPKPWPRAPRSQFARAGAGQNFPPIPPPKILGGVAKNFLGGFKRAPKKPKRATEGEKNSPLKRGGQCPNEGGAPIEMGENPKTIKKKERQPCL